MLFSSLCWVLKPFFLFIKIPHRKMPQQSSHCRALLVNMCCCILSFQLFTRYDIPLYKNLKWLKCIPAKLKSSRLESFGIGCPAEFKEAIHYTKSNMTDLEWFILFPREAQRRCPEGLVLVELKHLWIPSAKTCAVEKHLSKSFSTSLQRDIFKETTFTWKENAEILPCQ